MDAYELWKAGTGESSRGHTLRFHGAHRSVWVVIVVTVFPKMYTVTWIQTASIGKERIVPRITGEGHGNPLQSSRLETPVGGAWKLPWAEEPGRPPSTGSGRVEHDRATSLSLFPSTHWRRPWQPTPVFSPGESQGRGEPGGLPSMGSHRVRHDGSDLTAAAAAATGSPQKDLEMSLGGERMDPANHLTSG